MTAVIYFLEELHKEQTGNMSDLIDKVLEMEKQQIIDAYGVGCNEGCSYMTDGKFEFKDAEQYYNETYVSKGSDKTKVVEFDHIKKEIMTLQEAISILKIHQKWRLGADIVIAEPKVITEALDVVLNYHIVDTNNKV